jgi:hypothetical protein
VSLRTTALPSARRLAVALDAKLEDAVMLAESADPTLSKSQIDAMLRTVVDRHLTKLDRVALVAKGFTGFDPDQARRDDRRAFWTYSLLDASGPYAEVTDNDHVRMVDDGLCDTDIEAQPTSQCWSRLSSRARRCSVEAGHAQGRGVCPRI